MIRLNVIERKESILKACIRIAGKKGGNYRCITRQEIARAARCSPLLITHYFGGMRKLQKALIEHAIRTKQAHVIIQAVLNRDLDKTDFLKRVDMETREKIRNTISF